MIKNSNIVVEELDPRLLLENIDESVAEITPINEDAIRALANSIKENGQLENIIVYNGKLMDGRHRCKACLALGLKVKANVYDKTVYSREDIEDIVTSKEMINKDLTTTQKAIIAYRRYVAGHNLSIAQAAVKSGVKRHYISYAKTISENKYAITHNYIETLSERKAVRLPEEVTDKVKYSTGLLTIKTTLDKYDEYIANGGEPKEGPNVEYIVDYNSALALYDINDYVADTFWGIVNIVDKASFNEKIKIMHYLLSEAYPSEFDFDVDVTVEELSKICQFKKGA